MALARVLIIHENSDLSSALRLLIQDMGPYDVYVGNCYAEAVAAARDYRPDLLVLDAHIPLKHGSMVVEELRNDPDLGIIPVVYLSALAT
jgi:CheY-like chemotaxis protein